MPLTTRESNVNLSSKAAVAVATITMSFGAAAAPSSAAPPSPIGPPPAAADAAATTWYTTTATGSGKIRECYKSTCDWYTTTYPGETLWWSHYAYNEYGNKWYYVRHAATTRYIYGWLYCEHVTAGC